MTAPARELAVLQGQLGYGGSERQLSLLLQECDRAAWSVHVYAASHLGPTARQLEAAGIPVTLLEGGPVRKLLAFRRAVRQSRAQAVLSWSSWTNVFAWSLLGLGRPVIGSFRNAGFADLPSRLRPLWSWASLAPLAAVVCNSRETADLLLRRSAPGQRVLFVPNAVEPPADVAGLRRRWRRELGIGEDEVLVLGIGRLTPQKAFDRFVAAVALAHADTPLRAVVLGPDYEGSGAELEALIRATGLPGDVLRYLGPTAAAREVVCAADIYLLSSLHEGMPNVVLEAMAAGVPCVTTPVSGLSSILTHEVDGLITGHDARLLADGLVRLANDPDLRFALGARARRRLSELHSPARVYGPLWQALAVQVDRATARRTARIVRRTRCADVALCLLALVVLTPVALGIAVAVRLTSRGPALHRGMRVGRDGRPFVLHKFRTMQLGSDVAGPGVTAADDPRVTRVGGWLRRSKLDELPQILDVLAGHMSLVGPRPEDPRYVDLAAPAQRRALTVRPGLTSPASVQYRHESSLLCGPDWERTYLEQVLPHKLALDGGYVDNPSLPAYGRVLASTAFALLPRRRPRENAGSPSEPSRTPWP